MTAPLCAAIAVESGSVHTRRLELRQNIVKCQTPSLACFISQEGYTEKVEEDMGDVETNPVRGLAF